MKSDLKTVVRKGIHYQMENGKPVTYLPWIGDIVARLYDPIMRSRIFPRKFSADIDRHFDILKLELEPVKKKKVLEIAAGSGSAVNFLSPDNAYTGLDISARLLGQARGAFEAAGFRSCDLYAAAAEDLPFWDDSFDICLCILSLNFFNDVRRVLNEVSRVLVPGGRMVCSVPVPERIPAGVRLHGTLLSEVQISELAAACGFGYESIEEDNGALLYFRLFSR